MANNLSQALNPLDSKKTTKINLMTAISKDISKNIEQGYQELSVLIGGGSKKNKHTQARHILDQNNQVTTTGQKREQQRMWKRDFSSSSSPNKSH